MERGIKICPDFVIELRSPNDRLAAIQIKMVEYVENGLQLGWLIDPEGRQVFVYDSVGQVTHLENPTTISGEPLLAGFTLDGRPFGPRISDYFSAPALRFAAFWPKFG